MTTKPCVTRNIVNAASLREAAAAHSCLLSGMPHIQHVFCILQGTWLIKDTSTNGSFVNNVRVGKGNEVPLKVNDVLRLSQAVGEKNKLIECATADTARARADAPGSC